MPTKGMLIVMTEPPAEFLDEFADWYQTEHIPERLSVPGFETGLRFAALNGPGYLALYDLASPEVLETPAYLAVSGDKVSPWTRRVISRGRFIRVPTKQIYPGTLLTGPCSRLLLMRLRVANAGDLDRIVGIARRAMEGMAGVTQLRVFSTEDAEERAIFLLVEGHGNLEGKIDYDEFGSAAIDRVTTYVPC